MAPTSTRPGGRFERVRLGRQGSSMFYEGLQAHLAAAQLRLEALDRLLDATPEGDRHEAIVKEHESVGLEIDGVIACMARMRAEASK